MFTYETRAAMADEHRARLLLEAERARLLRHVTGRAQPRRLRLLALAGRRRPTPAAPPADRRARDRRVARIPVQFDRRNGLDRRVAPRTT